MLARARHERSQRGDELQSTNPLSGSPGEPPPEAPEPVDSEPLDSQDDGQEVLASVQEMAEPRASADAYEGRDAPDQTGEAQTPERLSKPVKGQLDRLAGQIYGLQQQLDAFIARRNEGVAERASHHVAAIVAAAEISAGEIRAAAEKDAATIRERLVAGIETEVEQIRTQAEADAARIRTEANAEAARAREKAIMEASAEIEAVCSRLSGELQAGARAAIVGIAAGARVATPHAGPQAADEPLPQAAADASTPTKQLTDEVQHAVQEVQNAAAALEQSLRILRAAGDEQLPDS